jgi:SPP1 gp7 family putative phage head morphogenesis protein
MVLDAEPITQDLTAALRKVMRVSVERILRTVKRNPYITELELRELLTRVGIRVLLPIMRRRYAEWGKSIQAALSDWRARATMAQDESSLPAEIGYWHSQELQRHWQSVASGLASRIAQRIVDGLRTGETMEQLMDGVEQILAQATDHQLERIVRTETTRYYNYALVWETATYPEVAGYRYSVVVDDRTSSTCKPLAGKIVRRAELRYIPPLHPNCRTVLVPLLAEDIPADNQPPDMEQLGVYNRMFARVPAFLLERLFGVGSTPMQQFWDTWLRHEPNIRRLCFSLARGDQVRGEDLYTATMLRAHERYYQYDPARSAFTSWAYHIARSIHLNTRKRDSREVLTDFAFERN